MIMKINTAKLVDSSLASAIARDDLKDAKKKLFRSIQSNRDFAFSTDSWSGYANQIINKIKPLDSKEKFWNDLNQTLTEAEAIHGDTIYRGVVYWALSSVALWRGDPYGQIYKLLNLAYQQDVAYFLATERIITQQVAEHKAGKLAAGRLINILHLTIDEVNKHYKTDPDLRIVRSFLSQRENRKSFNKNIASVFNNQFQNAYLNSLSWKPLDLLIGRNPYRAHIQSFYEAAKWLVHEQEKIEDTNLEKYGLTYAVMLLSGTFIEGVLLKLPKVRRNLGNGNPTFGKIVRAYFRAYSRNLSKEISASLRILLYYRNKIHPSAFQRKIDHRINFDFAVFMYRLAERSAILLAIRHKRDHQTQP